MELVDIVMPVKNSAAFISQSIESILNQSYRHIRLIVVYQESEDETFTILQSFAAKDSRILLLHDRINQGVVSALNLGLDATKAKYIARMDADDISVLNRIENQVRFLEDNSDIGVVGGWVKTFGRTNQNWTMPERDEEIRVQGLFSSMVLNPTAMFRSSLVNGEKRIRYEKHFKEGGEDFHFWYNLAQVAKFYNLQQGVLFYRIHGLNLTVQNASQIQSNTRVTLESALRDLMPSVSKDDLDTHFKIVEQAQCNVGTTRVWFNKLLTANVESGVYDQNALERRLELELKQIISKSHPLIYNVRMLKQFNVRFVYDRLPRNVRAFIRIRVFGK
jgi:glycosyltransferase involved in cell wall biosynthesis